MKTYWVHPDKKNKYFQINTEKGFSLAMVGGSLSSMKSFDSEEQAIKEGWVKE